uniref:G_PROTEIN_RECEP_F1_2 domain-containing protein n=1 Tax=Caenorhabditis japonica TaxID=281687 RepID=A0A8R1EKA7_CAEJA
MHIIFKVWHCLWTVIGCTLNTWLIFVAVSKSPKSIRAYATLIISFGITDLVECAFDWFVQTRLMPSPRSLAIIYIMDGPCKYFGAMTCKIKVLPLAQKWFPDYNFEEETGVITGVLDFTNILAILGLIHIVCPIFPAYTVIFILRRKIISHLDARAESMSAETKATHTKLLQALTVQAIIPAISVIAVICYVCGQTGLIVSPSLESSVFCIIILAPALSPLTSLYFIRPYREFTKRSFQNYISFGAETETNRNNSMMFQSTNSAPATVL